MTLPPSKDLLDAVLRIHNAVQTGRDAEWRDWLTDVINPEHLAELERQRMPPDKLQANKG